PDLSKTLITARSTAISFLRRGMKTGNSTWGEKIGKAYTDGTRSGLHESLQFGLAVHDFHDVLDLPTALLLLEVFRFLAHELAKPRARELIRVLARLLLGLEESLVELLDLFRLFVRFGANHAERRWRGRSRRLRNFLMRPFGLDGSCSGAEVALDLALFLLLEAFPEDVLILGVTLRQVAEAKALRVLQLSHPLRV